LPEPTRRNPAKIERLAFLERIAQNPDAAGPRLIMADWMIERNGDTEDVQLDHLHSRLIRFQFTADAMAAQPQCHAEHVDGCRECIRRNSINAEGILLKQQAEQWLVPRYWVGHCRWDRGFVVEVAMRSNNLRDLLFFERHPVASVQLLDWYGSNLIRQWRESMPFMQQLFFPHSLFRSKEKAIADSHGSTLTSMKLLESALPGTRIGTWDDGDIAESRRMISGMRISMMRQFGIDQATIERWERDQAEHERLR
jgi:uncharacterized protein (TIGR02996 family)